MDRLQPPPQVHPAFENPLGSIFDAIGDRIFSGINDFIDFLFGGLNGGGTGGGVDLFPGLDDLLGDLLGTKQEVVDANTAAQAAASGVAAQASTVAAVKATILAVQDGLPIQSYSHSMTNHECTFDRVDLRTRVTAITGSVSSVSGNSWSTHDHVRGTTGTTTGDRTLGAHSHSDSFSLIVSQPVYAPPLNSIEGAFIKSKWGGGRASIVYAIASLPLTPTPIYILVGRMSPDDGSVLIEYVSPDQSNAISAVGEQILNLPSEIIFANGESMWIGIHQPGTGNRRSLFGIELASVPREGLLYPPQQKTAAVTTAVLTAGTTIAAESFNFTSPNLPWMGIGQPTIIPIPEPTFYYEDFQSGVIPPTMNRRSGDAAVVTNGALMMPGGLQSDGARIYLITKKLNRDNHEISGQIRTPTAEPQSLALRSDAGGSSRVELAVTSSGVQIKQKNFFGSTTLASTSMPMATGDTLRLRAVGNVFTVAISTGAGEDDWATILTYTDSANALPRGSAYRYTTIGLDRTSFVNSGGWEFVLCRDLPD